MSGSLKVMLALIALQICSAITDFRTRECISKYYKSVEEICGKTVDVDPSCYNSFYSLNLCLANN